MISLRYHIVSIAAVFLALAVGVVLGSTTLSRSLLSGLNNENEDLAAQVNDLQNQKNAQDARLSDADSFAASVGPMAVQGQLARRTVVVVTTADAKPADRDALKTLITNAGATVTGELQLTESFSDPRHADQLKDIVVRLLPAGVQLPTASDPGTLAGGLLGPLLLISKEDNKPQASADETAARVSPNGRWVTYTSNESGRAEVYLDSYPRPKKRVLVSQGGGMHAVWRGDGRELYYWRGDALVAVPLAEADPDSGPAIGAQTVLFRSPHEDGWNTMYDVSTHGDRFVIVRRGLPTRSPS